MSVFEEKIRRNKSYFDNIEPNKGHKNRFIDKLNTSGVGEIKRIRYRVIFGFVAIFVAFVTAGAFLYNYLVVQAADAATWSTGAVA